MKLAVFDLDEQALKIFCDSLKSLGNLWTTERWMVQCRYDSSTRFENIELERIGMFVYIYTTGTKKVIQ